MNNTTHGHKAIKNEQTGSESNFTKANVVVCVCPKCSGQGIVSKPPYVPGDVHQWTSSSATFVCDLCNGTKVFVYTHYYTELSRILTAAKCQTVEEVVKNLERYHKEMEDYSTYHITTKSEQGELNFFTTAIDHKKALLQLQINSFDFQQCYRGDLDVTIVIKKLPKKINQ